MHVNILKAGLVVSKETLNLDLRISHTNYSVILGHLSLFLCFKICEHPQGTNALLGMIRNTVWLFSVILLFCTYSFGMYFLLLPSRTFLLVLAHCISSSVSLRILTLRAHGLVILPNSVIFTFKYMFSGDFPARPVPKTLHSQCRGPGFNLWSGN